MIWFVIAIIGTGGIALEDFRWRLVHLWWYLLLSVGLAGMSIVSNGIMNALEMTMWNLGFVVVLLFALTAYVSLKEQKFILPFDRYIGWGDVLFFVCVALYLDLGAYIVFMILSLVVTLILTPLIYWWQGQERHVPLAGIQALCLMLYLPAAHFKLFHFPMLLPDKL
ncbi:hypothetical protein [Sphingobacterium haloxyli]|uniref:Prepilin type IV endopeptidase peptidase domain-containing protein n=1 Tax=Sphingobacterium haloxyli TaxID=2100533 RepID=A0A2S9IWR9_9SPHI|nr:hypothetical protein [Sphingobacterium haloxyli]PRD44969.1 hypothetical protein C5745_18880 [Sphingobacterium haloxyli]